MSCPREENKQFQLNKLLEHVNRYSSSYSDWINYYSNVGLTSAGLNLNPNTNVEAIFGTVGVGTTAPNRALTVIGGISGTSGVNFSGILNGATAQNILTLKADGTVEYRTPAQVLTDIGAGSSGGALLGSGTINYIPRWTGAANLGNSQIYDNNTNVGIGTITPNHKLTVTGNVSSGGVFYSSNNNSDNWTNVFTQVQSNSAGWASNVDTGVRALTSNWQSTYSTFSSTSANYILQGGNTLTVDLSVGTNNTQNLTLETNSLPRIFISGSTPGNIGLGTIAPTYRLDLVDADNAIRGMRIYNSNAGSTAMALLQLGNNTNGAAAALLLGSSTNTTYADSLALVQGLPAPLILATSNAERIRIASDGKTGINTTAPNERLTVSGNISATSTGYFNAASLGTSSTGYKLLVGGETAQFPTSVKISETGHASSKRAALQIGDNWYILQDIAGNGTRDFSVYNGGSSAHRLAISTTGNVGIGTTAPNEKLTVVGNISATGSVYTNTPGTVLEYLSNVCDGSTVTSSTGSTYTWPTVTTRQTLTNTYADVNGSSLSYTPPAGTTKVIYRFAYNHDSVDGDPIVHNSFFIDSNEITDARYTIRTVVMPCIFEWTISIGGSDDFTVGRLSTWTTAKTLKIQARNYAGGYQGAFHSSRWWDGAANIYQFHRPRLTIIAIK